MRTIGRSWLSPTRLTALALAAAVGVLGGACADDDPTPSPATTTAAEKVEGLDLAAGNTVDLGDGWTLGPCEAGPPLFCFREDGETRGILEMLDYPTAEYDVVQKVLAAGGTEAEALEAQANEFHEVFQKDRAEGCGEDYVVVPFGPDQATVAGHPGVAYGFDGFVDDELVERAVQFAVIENDKLFIFATTAMKPGSCVDDSELEHLTIEHIATLELRLRDVIEHSTLPES